MILKCDDGSIPSIVEYIDQDKWKCVYLYADMLEFRTQGENFGLWVFQNENVIQGVAYRYYDTLHFYSRNHVSVTDMVSLINELSPKCITGEEWLIEAVVPQLGNKYRLEVNHIITLSHVLEERKKFSFTRASVDDVPEIATIMMEDKIYNQLFTYKGLCQQMKEGIELGKRRIYTLRDKSGKLLAAGGTYVETYDIVILGGLIVSQKIKGFGFGPIMSAYISNVIFNEGKQIVAFISVDNEDSVKMHRKMGYSFLGKNARLLRV